MKLVFCPLYGCSQLPCLSTLTPNRIIKKQIAKDGEQQLFLYMCVYKHTHTRMYLLIYQKKASINGVVTEEALEFCLNIQNVAVCTLLD